MSEQKSNLGKNLLIVGGINCALLVIIAIVMRINIDFANEGALEYAVFMMMITGVLYILNFITGIVLLIMKKRDIGLAFLISSFITGLIGFGLCILPLQ